MTNSEVLKDFVINYAKGLSTIQMGSKQALEVTMRAIQNKQHWNNGKLLITTGENQTLITMSDIKSLGGFSGIREIIKDALYL